MQTLSARLYYLSSREALASVVLPAVIVWRWTSTGGNIAWALRLTALGLLVAILVQGTWYWYLKLRSLQQQAPLPSYFHALFSWFKRGNLVTIGGMLIALLVLDRRSLTEADIGWTAGLVAGAVLEQVNYYHYQLMYDTRASFDHLRRNRRLRKPALAVDLARADAKTASAATA